MTSQSVSVSSRSSSFQLASPLASAPSQTASTSLASSSGVSVLHDEKVRSALRACEAAWEQAVISSSELSLALIYARSARRYARVVGHQMIGGAGRISALAAEGQSEVALVHRMLEQFAKANGIEVSWTYGDGDKPPKDG